MLHARFLSTLPSAAFAAALALPCAAIAQLDHRDSSHVKLQEVIGMRVHSASGEALGVIKDLLVDPRTRRIEYIAVEPIHRREILRRYPVDALVAGGTGEVVVDASFLSSSAGASTLAALMQPGGFSFATAERGNGEPVVDLLEGKLAFLP